MTDYDVIVKRVEPEWVIAVHEELAGVSEVVAAQTRSWPRLHAASTRTASRSTRRGSARAGRGADPLHGRSRWARRS